MFWKAFDDTWARINCRRIWSSLILAMSGRGGLHTNTICGQRAPCVESLKNILPLNLLLGVSQPASVHIEVHEAMLQISYWHTSHFSDEGPDHTYFRLSRLCGLCHSH